LTRPERRSPGAGGDSLNRNVQLSELGAGDATAVIEAVATFQVADETAYENSSC
jgi:hypothetical protein